MNGIKISKEEEKQICKDYLKFKNTSPIAKKFNRTISVIINVLKRNNIDIIKRLGRHVKLKCNDDYFEKIDRFDKAYFLGLIVSDGGVSERALTICLQEKDKNILEKFIKNLEYSGKLSFNNKRKENHQNTYRLTIYSRKLVKDLEQYGVIPAKSHHTYFPDIPEEFHSHFIRGVFDGDGHVGGFHTKRFTITGNKLLIEKIRNILSEKLNIFKCAISFKSSINKTSVHFRYSKDEDLLKIKEYLYRNCEECYIIRKKEKFDSFKFKISIKKCIICGDKIKAKGLCKNHYQNNRNKIISENIKLKKIHIYIYKYDINKKFIKSYNSIQEASLSNKIGYHSIYKNLKNKSKSAGGFIWKYSNQK